MKIFDNGLIQGDNWYIARSNGAVDGFTPAVNNLQPTGVFKVLRSGGDLEFNTYLEWLYNNNYKYLRNQLLTFDEATKIRFLKNFPNGTPDNILATFNNPNKTLLTNWKNGTLKGNPFGFEHYYYISENAVTHSDIGDFANPNNPSVSIESGKMTGGGHGQRNISYLEATGKEYTIEYTFDNGVRTGNVAGHNDLNKSINGQQSWFPQNWTTEDIEAAGNFVLSNNKDAFNNSINGGKIYDIYKGVRVGIIKTNGSWGTAFPDMLLQPNANGVLIKNPTISN